MNPEGRDFLLLKTPVTRGWTWTYPWLGLLIGVAAALFVGHPLSMVVNDIHSYIYFGVPLQIRQDILRSFAAHMWPMMLLYSITGGIIGAILGRIFQRLKENRLRLDSLHHEFELQVATLRHHYKNLALGIQGFSGRIKRKMVNLEEQFRRGAEGECPTFDDLHQDFQGLERHADILADASQRLLQLLSQELLFLRALTSETLSAEARDFYPFLAHCIQDLLALRFRDKDIRVEVNGRPLKEGRDSLVFRFEPYTLEVILQNLLANAMKFGDLIQVRVKERGDRVRVEVEDNGPGMIMADLKKLLLLPQDRRGAESTQLGLRVSQHLLEKSGGSLWAWSAPGAGAIFAIEVPKEPRLK